MTATTASVVVATRTRRRRSLFSTRLVSTSVLTPTTLDTSLIYGEPRASFSLRSTPSAWPTLSTRAAYASSRIPLTQRSTG